MSKKVSNSASYETRPTVAEQQCNNLGSQLTAPKTLTENEFFINLAQKLFEKMAPNFSFKYQEIDEIINGKSLKNITQLSVQGMPSKFYNYVINIKYA